jgi:flagellar biosynthesis chaperone FliJ
MNKENKTRICLKNISSQIDNIDSSLANLTKMKREKTQISKIRNAKGEIATNTKKIQGIIRDYFENLYSNKRRPGTSEEVW